MQMPVLETARLRVRPFAAADLPAIHQILDREIDGVTDGPPAAAALAARQEWLEWSIRNYVELARLYQPPYGDRAVVLRATGELIGAVGLVPCLMPFGQLPGFAAERGRSTSRAT